jgi:hypothetical protein
MECQHTAADLEQTHVCDDVAQQHGGDQETTVNQKAMAANWASERPDTSVTDCTGHMGYTFSPFWGGVNALEGVFGDE